MPSYGAKNFEDNPRGTPAPVTEMGTGKNRGGKLNILFINQYYYPDPAATAQIFTELCTDLSRWFNVTVVTGFPSYHDNVRYSKKGFIKRECIEGVRVIRSYNTSFSRRNMMGRFINYFTFFLFSWFAVLLCTGKQDIIVTMTDPPVISLTGYIMSKIKKTPFVYVIQDIFPDIFLVLRRLNNRLIIWMLDKLSRFLLKRADRIVAIGDTMRGKLIKKGIPVHKLVVIENWVDTGLIFPESKVNEFSRKYDLWDKFVVMYSGNLGANQKLEVLIEAASILKNNGKITFAMVGEGIDRENLVRRASELELSNVKFIPYQDRENLRYSLSSADVSVICQRKGLSGYVVPSKIYGILASGRAVLAAIEDESEVASIVRRESCGLVVEPENSEKMARAIESFYNNRHLVKIYGENARRAAEKSYSREIAVEKYRKLFEEIWSL